MSLMYTNTEKPQLYSKPFRRCLIFFSVLKTRNTASTRRNRAVNIKIATIKWFAVAVTKSVITKCAKHFLNYIFNLFPIRHKNKSYLSSYYKTKN